MYDVYIMKRTQIYLDEDHSERLAERAEAAGTTKSAVIREAVTRYLDQPGGEAGALARLKDAVRAAAGTVPRLPPGEQYVEALRANDRRGEAELERRWRA